MRCPFCNCMESKVMDSRPFGDGTSIRRRRECLGCHKRFTTYEKIETEPLMVMKKDGSCQSFDREKIMVGLIRAFEKRPVPVSVLENITTDIEQTLENQMGRVVTSAQIGEMVLDRLRNADEVAYIRFASVYRQFTGISSFVEELAALQERRKKEAEEAEQTAEAGQGQEGRKEAQKKKEEER